MIARRRNAGDHGVEPTTGVKPFAPFGIDVAVIHQVAGVQHEAGLGCVGECFAHDARPVHADIVLGIAKIDERERLRPLAGRREMEPFRPVHAVAHAIGILGARLEVRKVHGMVMGHTGIAFQGFHGGGDPLCPASKLRSRFRFRDLGVPLADGAIRSPSHCLRMRRVAGPRQIDPVGHRRRLEDFLVGHPRRRRCGFARILMRLRNAGIAHHQHRQQQAVNNESHRIEKGVSHGLHWSFWMKGVKVDRNAIVRWGSGRRNQRPQFTYSRAPPKKQ